MKAVFLHVLGDALGSVIVMISATVLWFVPVSISYGNDAQLFLFADLQNHCDQFLGNDLLIMP